MKDVKVGIQRLLAIGDCQGAMLAYPAQVRLMQSCECFDCAPVNWPGPELTTSVTHN